MIDRDLAPALSSLLLSPTTPVMRSSSLSLITESATWSQKMAFADPSVRGTWHHHVGSPALEPAAPGSGAATATPLRSSAIATAIATWSFPGAAIT